MTRIQTETRQQDRIVALFQDGIPLHVDELLSRTGMSRHDLGNALFLLELRGRIQQLPGKRFLLKQ